MCKKINEEVPCQHTLSVEYEAYFDCTISTLFSIRRKGAQNGVLRGTQTDAHQF